MVTGGMLMTKYEKYRPYLQYINEYKMASNAATGSKVDSNANVENKNITTMTGELYKADSIGVNRLLMHDKISEMYGENLADEYIRQLEEHEILAEFHLVLKILIRFVGLLLILFLQLLHSLPERCLRLNF